MSLAKWWRRPSRTEVALSVVRQCIDAHAASQFSYLRELRELVLRNRDPFVAVLIEGMRERVVHSIPFQRGPAGPPRTEPAGRITAGMCGVVRGDTLLLEQPTQVPMSDLTVTVFCDLSAVRIHGIFCGVDLVTASLGECPVAHFQRWEPGVKLSVQCERRRTENGS